MLGLNKEIIKFKLMQGFPLQSKNQDLNMEHVLDELIPNIVEVIVENNQTILAQLKSGIIDNDTSKQ